MHKRHAFADLRHERSERLHHRLVAIEERVVEVLETFGRRTVPLLEANRVLIGAPDCRQPLLLWKAEVVHREAQRHDRGLADADASDLVGLDERDLHCLSERALEIGCGEPTRCSAADHQDGPDLLIFHDNSLSMSRSCRLKSNRRGL